MSDCQLPGSGVVERLRGVLQVFLKFDLGLSFRKAGMLKLSILALKAADAQKRSQKREDVEQCARLPSRQYRD